MFEPLPKQGLTSRPWRPFVRSCGVGQLDSEAMRPKNKNNQAARPSNPHLNRTPRMGCCDQLSRRRLRATGLQEATPAQLAPRPHIQAATTIGDQNLGKQSRAVVLFAGGVSMTSCLACSHFAQNLGAALARVAQTLQTCKARKRSQGDSVSSGSFDLGIP